MNEGGDVLGRASLDSEKNEYTTTSQAGGEDTVKGAEDQAQQAGEQAGDTAEQAQKQTGGFFSSAKGAFNTIGSLGGSFGGSRKSSQPPSEAPNLDTEDIQNKAQDTAQAAKDTTTEAAKDATSEVPADSSVAQDTPAEGKDDLELQEPISLEDKDKAPDDLKETAEEAGGEKLAEGEEAKDKLAAGAAGLGEEAKDKLPEGAEGAEGLGEEAKDKLPEGEVPDVPAEGEEALAKGQEAVEGAAGEAKETAEEAGKLDFSILQGYKVNKAGNICNEDGEVIGNIVDGDPKKLAGKTPDAEGNIKDESGNVIGKVEPIQEAAEGLKGEVEGAAEEAGNLTPSILQGYKINKAGNILNEEGEIIGNIVDGDPKKLAGKTPDAEGNIKDESGNIIGKVEPVQAAVEGAAEEVGKLTPSILQGYKINKAGNILNEDGEVIGNVVDGDPKALAGKTCEKDGTIKDESGNVIGKVEPVQAAAEGAEDEAKKAVEEAGDKVDFSALQGYKVNKAGKICNEDGEVIGQIAEGDPKKLAGKTCDENGNIVDESGNVIGKVEAVGEEAGEKLDFSILKGCKVNKTGNVVNDNGDVVGHIVEGEAKKLQGKACDEEGNIWNDSGKVIGKAEPMSQHDRDHHKKQFAPFENFPDAIVEADGRITSEGRQVGTVVEGDPKRLKGSKVDEDGDILDRNGNTIGRAEAWDEPEPVPEEVVDRSILAGKRVNKAGNVVDSSGVIYGKVVEGQVSSIINRMCDKEGNIRSEAGDIIGRAELVPEGEREGSKEGPFAELSGLTVRKDGMVVTPSDEVVGRLIEGDGKKLLGRAVDEDGDVLDKNGNRLGKAERYEVPEEEEKKNPWEGRKVNKEGNVNDESGNLIGRLMSGDVLTCAGKDIDADGDVVNSKGQTLGHVSFLEDIPPEPEEPEEVKKAREQAEQDKQLANKLSGCIEQSLDRIRPICKLITDKIDKAERTPKEELDEEELVKQVKPLIEEGGKILNEAMGVIRGLDPDGRIQRQAKHKAGTKEATPEEYHLAEVLKEVSHSHQSVHFPSPTLNTNNLLFQLTGTITETIDNAKRKIEDMPHAKKELNPLWGLLMEPLGQILAAVGLLLTGVLGLVGRLLGGLGLGGIVDGLLGGLGLNKILGSLGLGSAYDALVGKDKKKDKK